MLHTALEDADYDVVVAHCGNTACAILGDPSRQIAGLVTDVNTGNGPSGWEVARHARALLPGLPVIYMTGTAAAGWKVPGVPHSVLLEKPFSASQMATAMATLLNAVGSDDDLRTAGH